MGRTQTDKFFTIEGRFDITIRVQAKDKAEAIAWANEYFNGNLIQINTNQVPPPVGPELITMVTKKIKKARRSKDVVVEPVVETPSV
jgi:hypothetical protein